MRLSLLTGFAATIVIHATVAQADVVTATNMDGGYVPSGYHIRIGIATPQPDIGYTCLTTAQEFIPTVSGRLTTLTAPLMRKSRLDPKPLLVSIFAKEAEIPGTPLGTLSVPYEDIDLDSILEHTFDLSALNIHLVAGQSYFAVFAVETVEPAGVQYMVYCTEPNDNSFGIPPMYYRLDANNGDPDGWLDVPIPAEIGLIVSVVPPPQEVQIDVDPDSKKNRVNLKAKRPKPLRVAVFGDADLDVLDVLPDTARFGDPELTDPELGTGAAVAPTGFVHDDVDGDGDLDLLLQFDVAEMKSAGAVDGDSLLMMLEAELLSGGRVFGFDLINQKTNKGKGRGGR